MEQNCVGEERKRGGWGGEGVGRGAEDGRASSLSAAHQNLDFFPPSSRGPACRNIFERRAPAIAAAIIIIIVPNYRPTADLGDLLGVRVSSVYILYTSNWPIWSV